MNEHKDNLTTISASGQSPSTILIVDDEHTTFKLLLNVLDPAHYRVLVADDGATALQQLPETSTLPDLILLDVMMPGINGFETYRRLKANPATCEIPVLFITALTDTAQKVAGFAAGGVDYITKPFQLAKVLARINAHLTIRRQHVQLQQQQAVITADRDQLSELNATKDKAERREPHGLIRKSAHLVAISTGVNSTLAERNCPGRSGRA